MKCSIPHDGEDDLPRFLCRICNPVKGSGPGDHAATIAPPKQRDFRIPKGMSDEEGAAMLAARAERKKETDAQRIARLKEGIAQREAEEIAKANEARAARNLPPLNVTANRRN